MTQSEREYHNLKYFVKREKYLDLFGRKCSCCSYDGPVLFICGSSGDLYSKSEKWVFNNKSKFKTLCQECKNKSQQKLKHGTYWAYRKHECRCEKCVLAYHTTIREWKLKQTEKKNALRSRAAQAA